MPPLVAGETRVTNTDTGGQKGSKLARFDLIPTGPLWELAELYGVGARKYAERNWERGYAWSLSYAAAQRHLNLFWAGESHDNHTEDCPADCVTHTGKHHLACAAFHLFAMQEFERTHPELDDRPGKGVEPEPEPEFKAGHCTSPSYQRKRALIEYLESHKTEIREAVSRLSSASYTYRPTAIRVPLHYLEAGEGHQFLGLPITYGGADLKFMLIALIAGMDHPLNGVIISIEDANCIIAIDNEEFVPTDDYANFSLPDFGPGLLPIYRLESL